MKKLLLSLLIFGTILPVFAQDHHDRFDKLDVKSYVFNIEISDENDRIKGQSTITILFKKKLTSFELDLVSNQNGKGMTVSKVQESGKNLGFDHSENTLTINKNVSRGSTLTFTIDYQGIPANGLVISKNKYGDRTFFGDNWPNRAHHWLPTVDHPSDKATVEWQITAPNHYQVVGNGRLIEESDLNDNLRLTRWKTSVPLSTKVMVFGAARFAVDHVGEQDGIPVSSWVYPQNREDGFYDYALAYNILDWFIDEVGPYPYAKLANVQSKTMFGGMENAGNIFYSENSIKGDRSAEGLLAHEIAHQWFGNSASEASWHHSWLSEGFATYFTNLYFEQNHGQENFVAREKQQRQAVINYSKRDFVPIINTSITDYMKVLSTNTYQKGGWVLHMLRREVGDEIFWTGIRNYYERFKHSNALTNDLKDVFEEVSGKELDSFFNQWTKQAGQPNIEVRWDYKEGKLNIQLNQKQNEDFTFDLDIEIVYQDGSSEKHTVPITSKTQVWTPKVKGKPAKIVLDPDTWLLFEGKVSGN